MAVAMTAEGAEVYRQRRNAVKERHAAELLAVAASLSGSLGDRAVRNARSHPRWKELFGDAGQQPGAEQSSIPPQNNAVGAQPTQLLLGPAYIASESTVRNDYSQHFVDTQASELPGNAVRNPHKATRFAEYPKLRRLINAKIGVLRSISHPPTYLQADLRHSIGGSSAEHTYAPHASSSNLSTSAFRLEDLLPVKYDVIIVDPPLEAYEWESVPSSGDEARKAWSWNDVAALPVPQIAAKESFVFLWVGSGASDGLERGREVLMRWGYRRCEDIVWIRTAPSDAEPAQPQTSSTFVRTVEHCLMGIRGTVRRSTDSRFVHCNIDTDVILWPGESVDEERSGDSRSTNDDDSKPARLIDTRSKPPEMMDLIENFCLGTRRLELFGRNRNLRRGWLTVGFDVGPDKAGWTRASQGRNPCAAADTEETDVVDTPVAYDKPRYDALFGVDRAGCSLAERVNLVPFDEEIEALRPKSPSKMTGPGHEYTAGRDHRREQGKHAGASQWAGTPMGNPTGFNAGQADPSRMSPYAMHQYNATHYSRPPLAYVASGAGSSTTGGGGAGLSGLGAGGRSVVSVPSGSELLSGAQANVLLNQHQQSGQWHGINGGSEKLSAPTGLSRQGSRRR